MKIVSFKIPKTLQDPYHYQVDRLNHFYDKLHQHPEVQITSIEKSDGTLVAGSHIGEFSPGEVFILGSSLPHVFRNDPLYYRSGKAGQVLGFSLYIDIDVWGSSFWASQDTLEIGEYFRNCFSAFSVKGELRIFLQAKLKQMESLSGFNRMMVMLNILHQIFIHQEDLILISKEGDWSKIKENEGIRMSDIIHFTMEESYRQISLEEVASIAHMTVEAFCRYFKTHTRKTYISFLNEIRIHNACKLLTDKGLNKSDIAYKTGFNNISYFNRTFKKITGKTPGEYSQVIK